MGILSIGNIVQKRTYCAYSSYERVVNLWSDSLHLTLAREGADAGPLTIVACGFDPRTVSKVSVGTQTVVIDGTKLPFSEEQVYLPDMPELTTTRSTFRERLDSFGSYLYLSAPEESLKYLLDYSSPRSNGVSFERNMRAHIRNCVTDILYGNKRRGVSRLKGCGIGLTPSGDDFIAGMLIGLNVLERLGLGDWETTRDQVLDWARRGNRLTDTFLYLASKGLLAESMKALIVSLDSGDDDEILFWTRRIVSHGATSGADLGVGFYMTLREGVLGRLRAGPTRGTVPPHFADRETPWP